MRITYDFITLSYMLTRTNEELPTTAREQSGDQKPDWKTLNNNSYSSESLSSPHDPREQRKARIDGRSYHFISACICLG